MKYLYLFICLIAGQTAFAQYGEKVGPLTGNPALQAKSIKKNANSKINVGTFDSTFIYTSDTINLPFFDEFSSNKFQQYVDDFPGATSSDLVHHLLDMGDNPISVDSFYTQQITFKRIFDVQLGTTTDILFPSAQVKIGELATYPVAHLITDVYRPYYVYDTISTALSTDATPDTVYIVGAEVFQDSARQFFTNLNDPSSIWLDNPSITDGKLPKFNL